MRELRNREHHFFIAIDTTAFFYCNSQKNYVQYKLNRVSSPLPLVLGCLGQLRHFFCMEERAKHIYHRLTESGELEVIDMYTGLVVANNKDIAKTDYTYTVEWGNAICEAVRNGMTMKQIHEDIRLPPANIIYCWRDYHPDFKERLLAAKRDRAEYYRDTVISELDNVVDKETALVSRLKIDAYKWAASKDDPSVYGDNIRVDTKITGQVGFYALRTGVPRSEEEKELTTSLDGVSIEEEPTEQKD